MFRFRDREEAARFLAQKLQGRACFDPLVLGVPRGGVVTGATLARDLGAELDVVLARKLRAPHQPELAVGSVAEDGQVYLDPRARDAPGLTAEYLEAEKRCQLAEIDRRRALLRGARPPASVAGRTVILTDDGVATGSTLISALRVVRAQGPSELIVAVPVIPPERLDAIRKRCDELVWLFAPSGFRSIGEFYDEFFDVSDAQVAEVLRAAARRPRALARATATTRR